MCLLGGKGIYDGLRDRAVENQQFAQEHYERGLAQLEDRQYELAIAEFELALRHDSSLVDARDRLQEAKEKVQAQVMPTSETRQDAARLLYVQAAPSTKMETWHRVWPCWMSYAGWMPTINAKT